MFFRRLLISLPQSRDFAILQILWFLPVRQRNQKSPKNHEISKKNRRTNIEDFLLPHEKQESAVYLVPVQLLISAERDFFLCTRLPVGFISWNTYCSKCFRIWSRTGSSCRGHISEVVQKWSNMKRLVTPNRLLILAFQLLTKMSIWSPSQWHVLLCNKSNEKHDIAIARLEQFVFAPRRSPLARVGRLWVFLWGFNGLAQF